MQRPNWLVKILRIVFLNFDFFTFSCRHMLETCQPIESAQIEVMFFVTHTNQKMSPSQTRLGTSSATEMRKMVMQM